MSTIETATLWSHIAAGFLALGAGAVALMTEKGGRRHRQAGKTFVGAMAFVSSSALVLFAIDPSETRGFLALVAVFSFYFAFSGYRVLSRKRPADGPAVTDWVAVALFGLAGVGLVAMGGVRYLGGDGFATVILVFGGIGTTFALSDVRTFRAASDPGAWIGEHVVRMGAAYIATVSAFSAVNFQFLPAVARWLWPTLLGTPVLLYLQRTYEHRFSSAD